MYRIGVITSDKQFIDYQTLNSRNIELQFVHIKKEEDFNLIDKLIIPHQELVVLDLLLEGLQLMQGLDNWLNNNKSVCCFGLSTYYVFQKIKDCPVKFKINKYVGNNVQLEKVLFYPSIKEYTCNLITSVIIEEVGEQTEVLSKNGINIIAFQNRDSIGCLFIPNKELDVMILNQYLNINCYV